MEHKNSPFFINELSDHDAQLLILSKGKKGKEMAYLHQKKNQ